MLLPGDVAVPEADLKPARVKLAIILILKLPF